MRDLCLAATMAQAETNAGVGYDSTSLDATDRRFWREIWDSVPAAVAAERGIEQRRFGPIQATIVTELAQVKMMNLVLGAAEPDAVGGGHLAAAVAWARERGVSPYVSVTPGL